MWIFKKKSSANLTVIPPLKLNWSPGQKEDSLNKLYEQVHDLTNKPIEWYVDGKKKKKFFAKWVRFFVILLGAASALLPTIGELIAGSGKDSPIHAGWTAVCLGATGTLLLLDRFFGFSSAWMRYIATELHLRQLLQEFQLEWEVERARWQGAEPSAEQINKILTQCKTYLVQVNTLIREETNAWVQEFQNSIKYMEETAKAKPEAKATGALNLTVTSTDTIPGEWELIIDEGSPEKYKGASAGINNLLPGQHKIMVKATAASNKVIQAEKIVTVTAGSITNETIALA